MVEIKTGGQQWGITMNRRPGKGALGRGRRGLGSETRGERRKCGVADEGVGRLAADKKGEGGDRTG